MTEVFNAYFSFIIEQLKHDAELTNNNIGYGFFIIPAIFWFIIMVLKYIILLIPIWLPLNSLTSLLKSIFNGFNNKKEEKDE